MIWFRNQRGCTDGDEDKKIVLHNASSAEGEVNSVEPIEGEKSYSVCRHHL